MRPVKSYEKSFDSAETLKSKATNVKRLLGGLRNIESSVLELNAKEKKQLADAISLISAISEHYGKASRVRRDVERIEAVENQKIDKLIKASGFAKLTSVGDKVAFISHRPSVLMLADSDKDAWRARYCLGTTFENELNDMIYSVASAAKRTSLSYQEVLDEAWSKFQESLPERHKRYAGLIERMEKVLGEDAKTA